MQLGEVEYTSEIKRLRINVNETGSRIEASAAQLGEVQYTSEIKRSRINVNERGSRIYY